MKTDKEIIEIAKNTIRLEAESVLKINDFIGKDFVKTIQHIYRSKGRVIVTGIGKSAIIAQKIVATFNSTGTPAIFMHAADAVHGDLGMIREEDSVICISKSGNSSEIKVLVPILRSGSNCLIAVTGNTDSFLAKNSHYVLNVWVEEEACPNNLAPTTSTATQLAMGDALAVALLHCRNFSSKDFAKYHPGGALGKKLYLRVDDLTKMNEKPMVGLKTSLKETIMEISSKRLGAAMVVEQDEIVGIVTDGDIRRTMENSANINEGLTASDIMHKNPKTIQTGTLAVEALEMLKKYSISQLPVADGSKYIGMLHLHDLLREGII